VETVRDMLVHLANRYSFRELAHLVGAGAASSFLTQRETALVQQLCAYGQRLFDLDAEDLENADAAVGASTDTTLADLVVNELVPQHLVDRGRRCRMRQSPKETPRAALATLHPVYRLLLEAMAARWRRRETFAFVATVHIASEYAPLLAWETVLGHAGDPAELKVDTAFYGEDSYWGRAEDNACPHTAPMKSAAGKALRVYDEPPAAWTTYLDRQHSTVGHALAMCAVTCKTPCSVVTSRTADDRAQVRERCRIAQAFSSSPLVQLRHAAPAGHGFGVPSPAEVMDAWQRSRESLDKRGGLGVAATFDDGYPLPGLPSLLGAIAGAPLTPDTLLADTAAEIVKELDRKGADG
jgi:hypothetical protein